MFKWIEEERELAKKQKAERKALADEWKEKYLSDETKTILRACQRGFDLYNGAYGSEAVVITHILELDKRIVELERKLDKYQ